MSRPARTPGDVRSLLWGRIGIFGERGAVAVEAAVMTPVIMALFFGIIEMGFLFKDYLAVAGAVRSAVRIASATPRNVTFSQAAADKVGSTGGAINFKDVEQLWVYKAATGTDKPVGFTNFSDCSICVKFHWDPSTKVFVKDSDNWPAADQNACSTSSAAGPPDRIGVYLRIKHDPFTGLVLKTVYIAEASIMTLEPMSYLAGCKP
jgi:hypothetical protein